MNQALDNLERLAAADLEQGDRRGVLRRWLKLQAEWAGRVRSAEARLYEIQRRCDSVGYQMAAATNDISHATYAARLPMDEHMRVVAELEEAVSCEHFAGSILALLERTRVQERWGDERGRANNTNRQPGAAAGASQQRAPGAVAPAGWGRP
jgi:hypothetical protein